jgi:CrcB protein
VITLAVVVAAGLGALARYALDTAVRRRAPGPFPTGTFLVNVSGSLLLGLLVGLTAHHGFPSDGTLVLGTGFAGGYTTLSTWAWESLALAEMGAVGLMALNVLGSLAVGLAAAAAGLGLGVL